MSSPYQIMQAARAAADTFVAGLALTPKRKKALDNILANEGYTMRRDKDGNHVQSTAWKTKLSVYWAENNDCDPEMKCMQVIKNSPGLYQKALTQLRADMSSLGYDTVILKAFDYTDRNGKKVLDFNVIVPLSARA